MQIENCHKSKIIIIYILWDRFLV